MLSRYCLSPAQVITVSTLNQNLGDQFLQSCAGLCVDSAQKIIELVCKHQNIEEGITIIPWWNRILYLHTATTVLIVSMLRPELYTSTAVQSWDTALTALRSHEHLTPFIHDFITTIETVSRKILENCSPNGGQVISQEGFSNTYFQEFFQDMAFDPDNFLFGTEDLSW
jgi:hypothetical protein